MSFLPEDLFEDGDPFLSEELPDEEEPVESDQSDSDDSDYDPAAEIWSADEDEEEPEQTRASGPAIQIQQTAILRENLGTGLPEKIKAVLIVMDGFGINLPIFLDGLSWGDPDCTLDAKIRYERSALLNSKELPGILYRWWKPPRRDRSKKGRPKGAKAVMQDFAFNCSQEVMGQELENLADIFKAPAGADVTEAELTGTSIPKMIARTQELAPNLWRVLMQLARSPTQRERAPKKDPAKVSIILVVIAMFEYTRSHHRGRLQKLFAIYFKFKGLSAKGFDTLHAIGLTMSNKWTGDAVGRISDATMKELKLLMDKFPWLMSYDNVLLPFKVFSQRVDKKTIKGNGTAGTVYIKRSAVPLSPAANRLLQEFRAEGLRKPLTAFEIFEISEISEARRQSHTISIVLRSLLDSPEFDFETYTHCEHSLLQPPLPVNELPCGFEHIVLQYLLGTVNIPEASYEDNSRLIIEWLRQLKLGGKKLQKKIGLERVMAWVGDQLTVDRLRNLFRFRAEDDNSFERLDWLVVPPGFLHISMAFANSIHKQHLGTSKGRGLSAAFDQLKRKGLQSSKTEGPFFHDLNETLHIVADAQIRELWMEVSGAKSLEELREKSPEYLRAIAEKIVSGHASSAALVRLRSKPRRDELKEQSVMFLRDVLPYIMFRAAIKHGDVGLIEDLIPQLLFRFIGGKNSKYSIEMLELLQGLHRDWPPEIKDFIRNNCWVINNTGRRTGHMPVDEAQEMNIKDIKVTHRSQGPNIDWKYLKKLHPAIHVIRSVSAHMETEFKTRVRGWKHTVPKKEDDIQTLQQWYRASSTHQFKPGRKFTSKSDKDRPTDIVTDGFIGLQMNGTLANWVAGRTIERRTQQDWASDDSGSD
ncbi:hypothetical protein DFH07DRAFT_749051 [Mycena maculata]|uniref:DUF6589 domain-containing protein n=1 Tax=Mycena maculata TaxID=230809 RepID=A0AAD7IKC5_9AGAR|nr:hypothetical protein DFH07DRAFT_749051 [Mycena maculata]